MLATHQDAERRYGAIRTQVLAVAEELVKVDYPGLKLTTINEAVLRAAKGWESHPNRRINWDWTEVYPEIKFRYPKRFECAVWNRESLDVLSFGRPTYTSGSLRLDFVEASPVKRKHSVFNIIIVAMRTYAEVLGANELRIMRPINDVVKSYYATYGFTYVAKGDYLFKRI
ncbi:hypothetical protein [Microbulbifer sp. TRSA005]|uniref:hypothetical protein n=1 Tax=Microbulbifer sp. TRSA005 TaxID=3243383 RepID=UPI0040397988